MLLGAPMAFFATLVACNNIIGLTDFTKGECPNARCDGAEGGPDQISPDGGEDVRDGGLDAKGADPTSWPKWRMPNYGEGGLGEPPYPLKYQDGTGESKDLVTNLVWKIGPVEGVTASGANARCAKEGADWRAPKRIELVTLLDYQRPVGEHFIDPRFGVNPETLLTTSEVREVNDDKTIRITGRYWAVNFADGKVVQLAGTQAARVLCVKGR